jgi:hypothetical protein
MGILCNHTKLYIVVCLFVLYNRDLVYPSKGAMLYLSDPTLYIRLHSRLLQQVKRGSNRMPSASSNISLVFALYYSASSTTTQSLPAPLERGKQMEREAGERDKLFTASLASYYIENHTHTHSHVSGCVCTHRQWRCKNVITFWVTRWVLDVWLAGCWSSSLDHT